MNYNVNSFIANTAGIPGTGNQAVRIVIGKTMEAVTMADFDNTAEPDWLTGEYTCKKERLRRQLEKLERGDGYA